MVGSQGGLFHALQVCVGLLLLAVVDLALPAQLVEPPLDIALVFQATLVEVDALRRESVSSLLRLGGETTELFLVPIQTL